MVGQIKSTNLLEFFRERVREAIDHQGAQTAEIVEFYLVSLLAEQTNACSASIAPQEENRDEPLALLFGKALAADPFKKIKILKKIGDRSLFTAGFFPDSLKRSLVDVDYCVKMGGGAYGSLSHMMNREPAFGEIFTDLSLHFVKYVDILSEVSEKSEIVTDKDLLQIYETWLKTGSERAKQRLSEEGILPLPNLPTKPQ